MDDSPNAPAPTESSAPAPIVPTPAEQVVVVPQKSAIQEATDRARTAVTEGKPLVSETPAEPARKPTPRDEVGKFTDQPRRRLREPSVAELDAQAPPEDGPVAEGEQQGEGEGEPAPTGEKPAEGQPAAKPDAEPAPTGAEGDEGGEGDPDGLIEVEVPSRRDGVMMKIPVETEEQANTLRMLGNSYMKRQEIEAERATIQQKAEEFGELEEIMEADPAGFALNAFSRDPETAERVALTLLADPKVWERVQDRIVRWEDPDVLETERTRIENQNLKAKEELREVVAERRAVSQNFQEVRTTVAVIIPPDMAEDEQALFYGDALRDLKEYAERNNKLTITVSDIPLILASTGRLRAYGIDPVEASERIIEARSSNRARQPQGIKRPAASAPAPSKPAGPLPPKPTGKELVQGSRRKRAAASVPAGGGSPTTAAAPPEGQTIAERLAWHRDRARKGGAISR